MRIVPLKVSLIAGVILTLLLLVVFYAQFHKEKSQDSSPSASVNLRPAPDFELLEAHGHPIHFQDLRGKTKVIHFWASWCTPCLQEIPEWVELAQSFKGSAVIWIAIHLDKNWEDANKILPTRHLTEKILSLWDTTGKVADAYGTFQFPETYLVSPDQKIIAKWVGPQDWSRPEIQNLIRSVSQAPK